MIEQNTRYSFSGVVSLPFEEAAARVREELAREGFGILTEIDIQSTLKAKLDVDFRPYLILGACNPPFAHRALSAEPDIGALLPCNVVVQGGDEPGKTVLSAMDPEAVLSLVENEDVGPLAREVRERIWRALTRVVEAGE